MQKSIKVRCPAKINLTLEVVNRREDGFHNIKSVMQMISLYDYLNIELSDNTDNVVELSGTSDEIPYDETNLVYKAAKLFLEESGLANQKIKVFIEKNIPIAAGLAGGSTDAAGMLWGLNYLTKVFNKNKLEDLCSYLGSDLNVCLNGGCVLATSRGEITEPLPFVESPVTLIKPKELGISAKEAYTKYAKKECKPKYNNTEKLIKSLNDGYINKSFLYNDLEYAVFDDYSELQKIKELYPTAVMSGSGSTYFILENIDKNLLGGKYLVINDLFFINNGVDIVS